MNKKLVYGWQFIWFRICIFGVDYEFVDFVGYVVLQIFIGYSDFVGIVEFVFIDNDFEWIIVNVLFIFEDIY